MSQRSTEIIAEIANAHQGIPEKAEEIALEALKAQADAIKFQVYFADELLTKSHPRYDHFRSQAFSVEIWTELLKRFVDKGARVYCDVFGLKALKVAKKAGVFGFKIHSSDLCNVFLLRQLAKTGKRILLATGGTSIREIWLALKELKDAGTRLVLLHGFQSYPTDVEESSLSRLPWLKGIFGDCCEIGFMDHVDADDSFAMSLPLVAMGMGATVIEKHITLDRQAKGIDYYSSLNPEEFAVFVQSVRRMEKATIGNPEEFSPSERVYRADVKKRWVATRAMPQGHVLGCGDLIMKRTKASSSHPVTLDRLLDRPLLREVKDEESLSLSDVSNTVWALVVARMQSSRLPGKALAEVAGMPALAHLFKRLQQSQRIDQIVLCTTDGHEDDPLNELARDSGIECFRGPKEDVLGRMLGALNGHSVDIAIRVTGDDILVDPEYVDRAVAHHLSVNAEYSDLKSLPSGTEVEIFDVALLKDIWRAARDRMGTEYLTSYVIRHRDQFRSSSVPVDEEHIRRWRLTLDTPEDYRVIRRFLEAMEREGKLLTYRLDDIVDYFLKHPDILKLNASVNQRQTPPAVCTDLDWRQIT